MNTPLPVLDLELTSAPTLNFAMEQSGVPVVQAIRILNRSTESVDDAVLAIEVAPGIAAVSHSLPKLRPGERCELGALDLRLEPDRLRAVREAERAQLRWRVTRGSEEIACGQAGIQVLAHNEWDAVSAPPALLASFVTPNAREVQDVITAVRDRLRANTNDATLDGYQNRSSERVKAMAMATYEALRTLGLSYVGAPASFEVCGQKVRLADALLAEKMGNCLDVTVLIASCLEQIGLSPLLVLEQGHAFPGVWLVDDRHDDGVVYDAGRLRNRVALGEVLFFDSSSAVADPPPLFDQAVARANAALNLEGRFHCAIDVATARRDGYRPLPLREVAKVASPVAGEESQTGTGGAAPPLPAGEAPARAGSPSQSQALDPVGARLKQWRDRLLDLSLRNKLLNFKRDAKTALPLDVPDIARFEDLLATEERGFTIHPLPAADPRDARDPDLVATRPTAAAVREQLLRDLERGIVRARLDESRMTKQATQIEREGRLAREEGGSNTLYAAIGFLRWFDGTGKTERLAPLLLVPVTVQLERSTRRLRLERLPEEEALGNQTLVEKMQRDFGLDLSALAAPDTDDAGVDVPKLLQATRRAIQRMDGWEVLDEVHLGVFQFTKFLMWKDLEANQDALLANKIVRHIASGTTMPFDDGVSAPRTPLERLDDDIPPAKLPIVLDADSTQTAAVEAALSGRSFVLQGPPGTGKSQTITNLIAAAIARGKNVLFISEKMAALDVVQRRLAHVGLGDFCLELHSHKAQKKAVLESFKRTLERSPHAMRQDWERASADLANVRGRLTEYVRALHAPSPLGMSLFEASGRLLRLDAVQPLRLQRPNILGLTQDEFRAQLDRAREFDTAAASVEPIDAHPFRLSTVDAWNAQLHGELEDVLSSTARALSRLETATERFLKRTGAGANTRLAASELEALIGLGRVVTAGPIAGNWRDEQSWSTLRDRLHDWSERTAAHTTQRARLASRWTAAFLEVPDAAALEQLFARWAGAFFVLAWIFLFSARRRLKPLAHHQLPASTVIAADFKEARESSSALEGLRQDERNLRESFGPLGQAATPSELEVLIGRGDALRKQHRRIELLSARSTQSHALLQVSSAALALTSPDAEDRDRQEFAVATAQLAAALDDFRSYSEALRRLLGIDTAHWPADGSDHLEKVATQIRAWSENLWAFRSWTLYRSVCREAGSAGLGALVEAHHAGELRAGQAAVRTEHALLKLWTTAARDAKPILRNFDGSQHHALVERFQTADAQHIKLAHEHISATLDQRVPRGGGTAATSETGLLQRELMKKARHKPLRKLFGEIPNLLTRLKPCLLMSPMSVAQYLPADGRRFDLVVFDEASQIGPHDAIGAIARGDQVVIVGDSKQLPPTAFFQKSVDDDAPLDDTVGEDMESILDQALGASLPQQMLGWHYRSRHEALIAFSNTRYYDDRLHIFPAARGHVPDLGIKFHHVADGIYDSGRTRTNEVEARALVADLVRNLEAYPPGERTFGVVTFSMAQQELVEELLVEAREANPALDGHFADTHPRSESVFVKNLENVQGDERDEIFFSICYGPDAHGKMAMTFGPVNRTGGERRLNVAVTRARAQLRVYASFTHEQIDTNRTKAVGTRHLKEFMRFAAEQTASATRVDEGQQGGDFDSDFERDVYDVLRSLGHRVRTQVGCGAYRIDLAVTHPKDSGVYALGIECDGAAYHSGVTARDRDRLRQAVLEDLGWKLHRIWSTDWIYNRKREIDRLAAALDAAYSADPSAARGAVRTPELAASHKAPTVPPPTQTRLPAPPQSADLPKVRANSPLVTYQQLECGPVAPGADIHEARYTTTVRELVDRVASQEVPIHLDELTRRVGAAFGSPKLTARLRRRILDAVTACGGRFTVIDEFVWLASADRSVWQTFRAPPPGVKARDVELIAMEEIAAAAHWVLRQNLSLGAEDLARETARLLGIPRVGGKVAQRILASVDLLAAQGRCEARADKFVGKFEP